MNMQLVNLYLPELRPRKTWLTADSLALSAIGFTLMIAVVIFFMDRKLEHYQREVVFFAQQKSSLESRVQRLKGTPKSLDTNKLDRELQSLKDLINSKQEIERLIEGQNLGNASGFSQHLLVLAQQSLPSISLDHIRLTRAGRFAELKGITSKAEDVPILLQNLSSQDSFGESQFGLMSIAKDASRSAHEFSLGFEETFIAAEEGVQ